VFVADIAEGILARWRSWSCRGAPISTARHPPGGRSDQSSPSSGARFGTSGSAEPGLAREVRHHPGRRRAEGEQVVEPPQNLGGKPLRVDGHEHAAREIAAERAEASPSIRGRK
jgi:hypothetical protein